MKRTILFGLILAMVQGCGLLKRKIVKIPVSVPCLVELPAEPIYPIDSWDLTKTTAAIEGGQIWKILDDLRSSFELSKAHSRSVVRITRPCLKLPDPR